MFGLFGLFKGEQQRRSKLKQIKVEIEEDWWEFLRSKEVIEDELMPPSFLNGHSGNIVRKRR